LGPDASTSLGTPAEGALGQSVALPLEGPGFQFNPAKDRAHRFGTVEMVQGIVRAAARVHRRYPSGAELVVGELSRRGGGDIPGHASHRSGRDVDLLFYLRDARDQPFLAKAIPIEPDGTGVDYQDLSDPTDDIPVHIDVARTWTLFESLLTDSHNTIGRIFLVEHVRAMLLEHAESIGAPALALARFSDLTCQPGFPHDDHAHLRWFCSVDDIAAGCEDTRPIYPWHRQYLSEYGVTAEIAGKRKRPRPSVTSHARAEARAKEISGPFDSAVVAFLQRRKRWVKQPHPGRRYCR
jgi:penicillin-insensitive murein endopeptidase